MLRRIGLSLLVLLPVTFSSGAFAQQDIDATNCELFVDKLVLSRSSHGSTIITPFVKILPARLDGAVKEVGFRVTSKTVGQSGGRDTQADWHNVPMVSVSPVNDYFQIDWGLMVGSDYGATSFEGLFYALTEKGTTYWAKTSKRGNFYFDSSVFAELSGYLSPLWRPLTLPTQTESLRYYNPQNCY